MSKACSAKLTAPLESVTASACPCCPSEVRHSRTIRTPGSGVWTGDGINMENYGVPPDVYIDNTPSDFFKGRDVQLEKAVDVLKADLAARKK